MAATAEKTAPIPDYTEDPSGYLLAKGWKPLGPPKSPRTEWIDPTKPWPDGVYSRIPVFSKDQFGNESRQTHKNEKNQTIQTEQVLWSPAAVPMTQEQAIRTQVEREIREAARVAREEAKKHALAKAG